MKIPVDIRLNLVCHLKFIKGQKGVDEVIKILELFLDEVQTDENISNAAKQGHHLAQFVTGVCYEEGIGVIEKDPKRAVELYEQAMLEHSMFLRDTIWRCELNTA